MIALILWVFLICTSCTYSVNMFITDGEAEDLIDETQTAEPDIKTDLEIPSM